MANDNDVKEGTWLLSFIFSDYLDNYDFWNASVNGTVKKSFFDIPVGSEVYIVMSDDKRRYHVYICPKDFDDEGDAFWVTTPPSFDFIVGDLLQGQTIQRVPYEEPPKKTKKSKV